MAVNNSLARQGKEKFSVVIQQDAYKNLINNTLGDPQRAKRFVAAVSSVVGTNPALQECDANSILTAALIGEGLNLSPSPQLGQYYLVPFNLKERGKVAQFQIGYKGYIQLAIRSGQYQRLNVLPIKEGELIHFDPLEENIQVQLIQDGRERETAKTVGYYAMFKYLNGFQKAIYWSREKMQAHAQRYSKAYRARKGDSFWEKDFDMMGQKTMLRQLISKWGVMSTEFTQIQYAFENDMRLGKSSIDFVGTVDELLSRPDTLAEALPEEEKNEQQEESLPEPELLENDIEDDFFGVGAPA